MSRVARFSLVALDCREPRSVAEFYGAITGWNVDYAADNWVQLAAEGGGATIAFQHAPDHQPPSWPNGPAQQAHLDFDVPDLDVAEERVLALGAEKADVQPKPDSWRVFLDPAGHPFCLVLDEELPTTGRSDVD